MPDDAEIVEKLKIRYKKEKRIKDYTYSRDTNVSAGKDRFKRHMIDQERCAESLKTDLAAEKRRIEREVESTQIANKIADGETPTKAELAKIEKNPAVRLLVKQHLKQVRGYDTHEMYANSVADAYETSRAESTEERPITEFDRLQNRKLVTSEIKDLEGLRAQPDKDSHIPTVINLIVDEGVYAETDGHTVKIRSVPKTKDSAPSKEQGEDQDSGVWS